jgi:hypothetical protein
MPSFTPPTSLRNPPVLDKQRTTAPFKYYKGTAKAPNVFVWSDGRVAENYNPPTDRAKYEFLGGHQPVGVTDTVAANLLTAGYSLYPDDIISASVVGSDIVVVVENGTYSRGVGITGTANITWSVSPSAQKGSQGWAQGASTVTISGISWAAGTTYTISLTPANAANSGNVFQFVYTP